MNSRGMLTLHIINTLAHSRNRFRCFDSFRNGANVNVDRVCLLASLSLLLSAVDRAEHLLN